MGKKHFLTRHLTWSEPRLDLSCRQGKWQMHILWPAGEETKLIYPSKIFTHVLAANPRQQLSNECWKKDKKLVPKGTVYLQIPHKLSSAGSAGVV